MERDEVIDIVRGLAMVLIVLGHTNFPMRLYIYLFHVAVFFIVAGWCWNDNYSDGIKELQTFIIKKIKTLYIPYVAWLSLFSVFHNFFLKINFYSDNVRFLEGKIGNSFGLVYPYSYYDFIASLVKNFLFLGNEQLAGASWFIRCLFVVMVLWTFIDFFIKKIIPNNIHIARFGISCLLLGVGNYLRTKQIYLPGNLSMVFSSYIMFGFGIYFKIISGRLRNSFLEKNFYKGILIVACVVLLAIMNTIGMVDLSMNTYENVLFFLLVSIIGWILLKEIASIINKYKIKKVFILIGRSTMWILFLHFFIFKMLNAFQVIIYGLPLYRIASFPTLYMNKGEWIAYTMAGVFGPIYVKQLVEKLLKR